MAIVGLMVLQGLRSKEVIALDCEDVQLAESRICVHGKGNKVRVVPLASDTVRLLDHCLRLERPAASGTALFVSLKGRARGTRITPAGLRSLFRYHRLISDVSGAHPHRFRHYASSRTMPPRPTRSDCGPYQMRRSRDEWVTIMRHNPVASRGPPPDVS
jgi:integrase